MAKKSTGLGKGLDSLIPDFYDEDFDSNSAVSLEDMLSEDEKQEEENRIAGRNPVMEALKSGTPLDTIYMSGKQGILGQIAQLAADQGIPVKIVSDARLSIS